MTIGVFVACYLTCGLIYVIARAVTSPKEEIEYKSQSLEHLSTGTMALAFIVGIIVMPPIWPVLWVTDIIDDIKGNK